MAKKRTKTKRQGRRRKQASVGEVMNHIDNAAAERIGRAARATGNAAAAATRAAWRNATFHPESSLRKGVERTREAFNSVEDRVWRDRRDIFPDRQ